MDDWTVRKLVLSSIIMTIISIVFIYYPKTVTDVLLSKQKHFLIVGILSAPENFDKRVSLRKTWLQLSPEISSSYYFIIGKEICLVPPIDRANIYSCTDSPYVLSQNVTLDTEFTTMKIHSFQSESYITDSIGFGFYVRQSIAVKRIGILKEFVEAVNSEIQVHLVSAASNNILASVSFSPDMLSNSDLFLTKTIKTLSLKSSDEAFVKVDVASINKKFYPSCSFVKWDFEPNVLHYTYLWEEDSVMPQPFTEKSCSFVFLTYKLLDIENIRELVKNRTLRQVEWKKYQEKLFINLKSESQIYQDVLFVDVIDVYRNLSKKMIHFYKKVVKTQHFHYILKADDDSFIDLLRVYNQLQSVNKKNNVDQVTESEVDAGPQLAKFWLWSYIKEYWKVQRAGKWREDHYQSALYPSFPCGGGYVISKGIADYIVANEQNLHNFQGEDVSLGIWLSSLPVTQYKISKKVPDDSYYTQKFLITKFEKKNFWNNEKSKLYNFEPDFCQWTCNNERKHNLPLCNKVQLSVQNMYKTWTEYIKNGFL